ncbi:UNVERIFIED_CONTAM: hypothetical protein Slati_2225000 [Sesamum latifolium]|uniref:DUF4283 domain-containing protein n=1 Tax=Sesamum latifolium TaxID=2727402 RepID=A0AAW2WUE7_9LAMI
MADDDLKDGALVVDNIATAFNNSSRRTLSYIPPLMQNGEVVVRPSMDVIRDSSRRWNTTAVGYFLGRRPYFRQLNSFVRSLWPGVRDVTATSNGFFFFQFKVTTAMEEVPVWIRLRHLPVELWTNEGLSIVASGIGRPLYRMLLLAHAPDWTSLVYALCWMLARNSLNMWSLWSEQRWRRSGIQGGRRKSVKERKPVAVGTVPPRPPVGVARTEEHKEHAAVDSCGDKEVTGASKGKEIVLFNTFDPYGMSGPEPERPSGSSQRTGYLSGIVIFGILETRVTLPNATRVQQNVLSRWKWFTDYTGPGNRIWVAWDDEYIDIDILDFDVNYGQLLVFCLAQGIDGEPWLVGGDFNAVVDMSEVCGHLGDIRRVMEEFRDCIAHTRLIALPQKSHLIVPKSAHDTRADLLQILGFEEGTLPLRYLGLPLISSRLTLLDCKPLLQKIDNRIAGWEGIQLSFAGRLQLIKSVLMTLEVYWGMAFILPKGILREVEKRLCSFLWKGTSNSGYPKMAWDLVCRPTDEGD